MSRHGTIVPFYGPTDGGVLFLGEAPGRHEAQHKPPRPFVGSSGQYQAACLKRRGVDVNKFRLGNIVGTFLEGNPDPSPELIREWTPRVEAEIRATKPRLICGIGNYATKWLLGERADLGTCWGVPWPGGYFDQSIAHRANGAVVMCGFHPAYALRSMDKGGDPAVRAIEIVQAGYDRIARAYEDLLAGQLLPVQDQYEGQEDYRDVTGKQLVQTIKAAVKKHCGAKHLVVGFDTEGEPGNEYSFQVSFEPGTGSILRTIQPDFKVGVAALQQLVDAGALIVFHCASTPRGTGYDMTMARNMGLNLSRARVWDTMFAAYLLRHEPHGAKALGLRWCGMRMMDFDDLVGPTTRAKQIAWLCDVLKHDWPKPETRVEFENDGTCRLYTPNCVEARVEKMLDAIFDKGKDPEECWANMDGELARLVEQKLGRMPGKDIRNAPLNKIIRYACADCDFEIRAYYKLHAELERCGTLSTMNDSMRVLPAFHLMQTTGMPASRARLEAFRSKLHNEIRVLGRDISKQYYSNKPFNPKSPVQVGKLMLRRGLEPAERTKTGRMSTGKKAIEHLRKVDEAMAAVSEWREKQHVRDTYCNTTLALMQPDVDIQRIHCNIKPLNTTTRRLATTDPPLLAYPKHDKPAGRSGERADYGKQIRSCFVAAEGYVFAEIDLSQIEARVLAHESADPVLCRLFIEGRDVHTETAAKMFGAKLKDFERRLKEKDPLAELQRFLSKKITFGGIMYGQTGNGLAVQLRMMGIEGWSGERCEGLKKDWRKLHKIAAQYIDDLESDTAKTGMVRDYWDMPRYLPAVWADTSTRNGRSIVAEAKRQAVNHRIQGTAQGLLQNGLAWLYPKVLDYIESGVDLQLCLSIHDSLLLVMPEGLYDDVSALVIEALTKYNGLTMRVPVTAESKKARSWGEL